MASQTVRHYFVRVLKQSTCWTKKKKEVFKKARAGKVGKWRTCDQELEILGVNLPFQDGGRPLRLDMVPTTKDILDFSSSIVRLKIKTLLHFFIVISVCKQRKSDVA